MFFISQVLYILYLLLFYTKSYGELGNGETEAKLLA